MLDKAFQTSRGRQAITMAAAVDTLAVLREVLPGGGADVDETVLTYMAEMLQEKTMSLDDLRESLGPLLCDSGAVPEGSRARGRR